MWHHHFVPVSLGPRLLHASPEWYVMAAAFLSALGVLAVLAVIMAALCSFLRHPADTPLALVRGRGSLHRRKCFFVPV